MELASTKLVLGIDPGLHGATAILDIETKTLVAVFDMPTTPRGDKLQIDLESLKGWIDLFASDIRFAFIEEVGAMTYTNKNGELRGQGARASFQFGFHTGVIHGLLAGYGLKTYLVKPSVWKMSMGLSAKKSDSIAMARDLFPDKVKHFHLKKHDGRAEASLLAYFGAFRMPSGNKFR